MPNETKTHRILQLMDNISTHIGNKRGKISKTVRSGSVCKTVKRKAEHNGQPELLRDKIYGIYFSVVKMSIACLIVLIGRKYFRMRNLDL